MPNRSDVRPTSHDRHDPLLVAALAAGDLAATDRVHAMHLIDTCAECATLHDDLVAIARATATVPPPITTRPRDFRITPEQARRLRPAGWRRLVGALAGPRLAFAKPLGIGLTTIGLAGLLLGNISIGLGGAASAPAPAGASIGAAEVQTNASAPAFPRAQGDASAVGSEAAGPAGSNAFGPLASAPAASAPPAASPSAAPAASSVPAAAPSNEQVTGSDRTALGAAGGKTESPGASSETREAFQTPTGRDVLSSSPDLRTVIFVAAVVVGLGLLVLRRVARRVTSA